MDYSAKYLKYKQKYNELQSELKGGRRTGRKLYGGANPDVIEAPMDRNTMPSVFDSVPVVPKRKYNFMNFTNDYTKNMNNYVVSNVVWNIVTYPALSTYYHKYAWIVRPTEDTIGNGKIIPNEFTGNESAVGVFLYRCHKNVIDAKGKQLGDYSLKDETGKYRIAANHRFIDQGSDELKKWISNINKKLPPHKQFDAYWLIYRNNLVAPAILDETYNKEDDRLSGRAVTTISINIFKESPDLFTCDCKPIIIKLYPLPVGRPFGWSHNSNGWIYENDGKYYKKDLTV